MVNVNIFPDATSRKINELCLPQSIYIGLRISEDGGEISLCSHDGSFPIDYHIQKVTLNLNEMTSCKDDEDITQTPMYKFESILIKKMFEYSVIQNYKIHAVGISVQIKSMDDMENTIKQYRMKFNRLLSRIWFELDALPFLVPTRKGYIDEMSNSAARKLVMRFSPQFPGSIPRIVVSSKNEVDVDLNHSICLYDLNDIKSITKPSTWKALLSVSENCISKKIRISFFNSTPQGGGVALMRHSMIRLLKLLNVDAHWYVAKPKPQIFDITKRKFHNVLQGVTKGDVTFTDEDKNLWIKWCHENAFTSWKGENGPLKNSDIIIIDDPQVCGIIPIIKRLNPQCKIIFRSHIEIRSDLIKQSGSLQSQIWQFLWQFISQADLYVSHPVMNFIPHNVPMEKVVLMPASTDPLDGLGKELSNEAMNYYKFVFNRVSMDQNSNKLQKDRKYIAQIARFDPSKGIFDVLLAYKTLRERLKKEGIPDEKTPQLVICGHGSIDDPDGSLIYEKTITKIQSEDFLPFRVDICVARLPASDQLLNTILSGACIALQLSLREGFEIKVTEAIHKGVPIIAYRAGGIPFQINHGETGFLVPIGDYCQVADLMYQLLSNPELHKKISSNAKKCVSEEFFTPFQVVNWLYLASKLYEQSNPKPMSEYSNSSNGENESDGENNQFLGKGKWVKELWQSEYL